VSRESGSRVSREFESAVNQDSGSTRAAAAVPDELIVSCEHGGNEVPETLQELFAGPHARRMLRSHRGYDPGSADAARFIADRFAARLQMATVSRLVVDLNRSLDNDELFSRFTAPLDAETRQAILDIHYRPHRDAVTGAVQTAVAAGRRVVHVSVHTFTPRYRGTHRPIDVGLLFDPARSGERTLCERWRDGLRKIAPRVRVAENEPYAGTADGFTTWLRRRFDDDVYVGIELELNNRIARFTSAAWGDRMRRIGASLEAAIGSEPFWPDAT
jgi:predicted N-formylglutamate amidohydrolase